MPVHSYNQDPTALSSPGFQSLLDLIRWVSAWLVLVQHLRQWMFVRLYDIPDSGPLLKSFYVLFYAATGYGRTAVDIFFVLSGYLVGGLGLKRFAEGRFSWVDYSINRTTRLYVVLIPALLLTLVLDYFGKRLFGPEVYTNPDIWQIFVGNLLMLQDFFVPPLGTNGPLWSLSYEFWFYVVFGLVLAGLGKRAGIRLICLGLSLCVLLILGRSFVAGLAYWLFGAAAAMLRPVPPRGSHVMLASVFFLAALAFARIPSPALEAWSHLLVTLTFAGLLWTIKSWPLDRLARLSHLNTVFANFSYTLYATHYPIIIFLMCCLYRPKAITYMSMDQQPTAAALALYAGLAILILVCAWLLSLVTERQTARIRHLLRVGHRS